MEVTARECSCDNRWKYQLRAQYDDSQKAGLDTHTTGLKDEPASGHSCENELLTLILVRNKNKQHLEVERWHWPLIPDPLQLVVLHGKASSGAKTSI